MLYVVGKAISKTALKIYAALALVYGVKVFIHVEAVANNMPEFGNLSALFNFMTYAAVNTDLAVQFIVFGTVALVAWVLRDSIRSIFSQMKRHSIQSSH